MSSKAPLSKNESPTIDKMWKILTLAMAVLFVAVVYVAATHL
ncbi:MAG: hypothetical protein RBQ77_03770 [Candidatus Methanomethylophilaceae archaeon]|jgi:hypothetical protein|nr:hypothetical protein [Candidatus Methanomethylophilaceae archaeon]